MPRIPLVSEANMTQFTIDAFLLESEILYFGGNGLPFMSQKETQGECKIRRLTGSLRIAEYIFVAKFVPFRHLFIFCNDREWTPGKRRDIASQYTARTYRLAD